MVKMKENGPNPDENTHALNSSQYLVSTKVIMCSANLGLFLKPIMCNILFRL